MSTINEQLATYRTTPKGINVENTVKVSEKCPAALFSQESIELSGIRIAILLMF